MTLRMIIDHLVLAGLLSPSQETALTEFLANSRREAPPNPPWFVNALIMVGAWLSAIFFLGFSFSLSAPLFRIPLVILFVGTGLIISTIVLHEYLNNNLFLKQLSFALNLAGQALFIHGILSFFDFHEIKEILITILTLETVLLVVYRYEVARFLAILIATSAALGLCYSLEIYQGQAVLIWITTAGATWCWLGEPYHLSHLTKLYQPLGYGLVVASFSILVLFLPKMETMIPVIPTTLGLTILLLIAEYRILCLNKIPLHSPPSYMIFGSTLVIAGLLYPAPGVIAAILILLLGFQQTNRVLMGMAILFLAVFLSAYYYQLNMTLLMKSITLMVTGITLLGLRRILQWAFPLSTERGG